MAQALARGTTETPRRKVEPFIRCSSLLINMCIPVFTCVQVRTVMNSARTRDRKILPQDGFNYSTTRMINKYLEVSTRARLWGWSRPYASAPGCSCNAAV